jgi:hypothetical protein
LRLLFNLLGGKDGDRARKLLDQELLTDTIPTAEESSRLYFDDTTIMVWSPQC